jgi:hypothetical protein
MYFSSSTEKDESKVLMEKFKKKREENKLNILTSSIKDNNGLNIKNNNNNSPTLFNEKMKRFNSNSINENKTEQKDKTQFYLKQNDDNNFCIRVNKKVLDLRNILIDQEYKQIKNVFSQINLANLTKELFLNGKKKKLI